MVFDRRSVLLMAGSGFVAACSGGAVANRHDASANVSDEMDSKVVKPVLANGSFAAAWSAFKGTFVQADGRVVDTGNNGISHSEGQGYGMVLAARAGDRKAFDAIFAWTEKMLARPNDALFFWRYDPRAATPLNDPNNATDGDMLIAWGLMEAAARWKERHLSERAAAIRAALHDTMLLQVAGETYLLPGGTGFTRDGPVTLNPAYYVWPALQRFRAVDGAARWDPVMRGGTTLLARARFGPQALPTDWVDVAADGSMAPAADRPARFGFDAIRVPLYLSLVGRSGQADNIARFWKSYGTRPIPAWIDVRSGETAPYPLSPGGMAVVHRLLGQTLTAPAPQSDYYAAVLQALAVM